MLPVMILVCCWRKLE